MKNELSPAIMSLVGGVIVLALTVGGFGYYFYTSTNVDKPGIAETTYPTQVLSQFESNGVFIKTKELVAPGGGKVVPATPVPVTSGELGKSDLGSLE